MIKPIGYVQCNENNVTLITTCFVYGIKFCLDKLGGSVPYLHCSSTLACKDCTPCKTMLAKSHLFLVNIKQIPIHFDYMKDQEKK